MINLDLTRAYIPMTETAYYILLSLKTPRHGYGIMQHVAAITNSRLNIGAGTIYGSLSKMESDGLIRFVSEINKRKTYEITSKGKEILSAEIERITELYLNSKDSINENENRGSDSNERIQESDEDVYR